MINKIKSNFAFTEIEKKMEPKSLITLIIINILLNLFFIQSLRAYFPGIRNALFHVVFGEEVLVNLSVLLVIIFLFIPGLTNTICKKINKRHLMFASIYSIIIFRLLMAFHFSFILETIFSGVIIMFYGFYMSTFLTIWIREKSEIEINHKIVIVILSYFSAFLIDYLIRTIGFTQDISLSTPGLIADWRLTQYIWLIIQVPLSVLCIYLTKIYFPKFSIRNDISDQEKVSTNNLSTAYSLIFCGIGIFLFLQFNLFLYPNGIGQLTNTNYFFNNIINIISLMITLSIVLYVNIKAISNLAVIVILNIFLILSLSVFFILGKQLTYTASILISISLIIMYLDFYLLFTWLAKIRFKWEKLKTISNGITIGFAFLVLFSFLHAFTTEWAAILAMFKNLGPMIMILAGIIFSISTILTILLKSHEEVVER